MHLKAKYLKLVIHVLSTNTNEQSNEIKSPKPSNTSIFRPNYKNMVKFQTQYNRQAEFAAGLHVA